MKGEEIKPKLSAKDLIEDAAQTPPNLAVFKNAGIGNAMKKEAAIALKEVEPKKLPEKRSHSSQTPKVGKDLGDSKNAGIENAMKKGATIVSKEVEPKKLPKGISEFLEPPPYQAAIDYAMQQVAAIASTRAWKPPSDPAISVAERVMKELEAVMVGDPQKARKPLSDSEDEDIDHSDDGEISDIAHLKEACLFAEVDRKLEKLFAEVALAEGALPEPTDSKNCCRERKLERAVLSQDMSRIFEKINKKNKADETKKEASGKKQPGSKK